MALSRHRRPLWSDSAGRAACSCCARGEIEGTRRDQRQVATPKAIGCGLPLMPERIDERRAAHALEALVLLRAQLQVDRGEVVAELLFGPGADDEARDCARPGH